MACAILGGHTWRIDGLRIVFQKVSKKRKIDECAEIMPFGASADWRLMAYWLEVLGDDKGVQGGLLFLRGVLMLPYRGKHAGRV